MQLSKISPKAEMFRRLRLPRATKLMRKGHNLCLVVQRSFFGD